MSTGNGSSAKFTGTMLRMSVGPFQGKEERIPTQGKLCLAKVDAWSSAPAPFLNSTPPALFQASWCLKGLLMWRAAQSCRSSLLQGDSVALLVPSTCWTMKQGHHQTADRCMCDAVPDNPETYWVHQGPASSRIRGSQLTATSGRADNETAQAALNAANMCSCRMKK